MANKKISELTTITGLGTADADKLIVLDSSESETKAITVAELKVLLGSAPVDVSLQTEGMLAGSYTSSTNFAWDLITGKDTLSGWSGSAYTVPVGYAGWYTVEYGLRLSGATTSLHQRYVDGVFHKYIDNINNLGDHHVTDLVYLEEGEVLSYRPLTTMTVVDDATRTWMNLKRIS